jgi:hypothetical protein
MKGSKSKQARDCEDSAELVTGPVYQPADGWCHCWSADAFNVSFTVKVAPLTARATTTPASA